MTNQKYPFFLHKSSGFGVFLRSYAHHYEVVYNYPRTTFPMISHLWISSGGKQFRL